MMEKDGQRKKLHGIMICVPYQGHLTPFVNLALKLASNGISITFVQIQFLHRKLCAVHRPHEPSGAVDFFSGARESGLDIRYTTMNDPFPLDFDRDLHFDEYWEGMIGDFASLVDEFVADILLREPDMLHFLVADTIYPWPAGIAHKHNLLNVSFWTQSALVYSLGYHSDLLLLNGHLPCKDDGDEEIRCVPGIESISSKDLMAYMKESQYESVIGRASVLLFENGKKADFVLHNTVEELEPQTLSVLNSYLPNYAIGPLTFSKNLPTVIRSFWSDSDCTPWLVSKPPGSVLYVSFGSFMPTSRQFIEEIANGLMLSGVYFVWVIRQGVLGEGSDDVFPPGIEERGLIVGWCDQVRVLSDPAIGGFLTHSGWNSTLESMWSGVPMICFPMGFDQPCNRKLVIDDWEIGINLCEGSGGCADREQVAHNIKRLMKKGGGGSERLRENASRVRKQVQSAVEIDGSSETNFKRFIKDLEAKIGAPKI